MKNWDDLAWFGFLLVIIVFFGSCFGFYAACQDHQIKYYFVSSHGANQGNNGYCIDGYREWSSNAIGVFCSDNMEKTLVTVKQLNDTLVRK